MTKQENDQQMLPKVVVPRPNSSMRTSECRLACFKMTLVSDNSTMNVLSRSKMLSAAPILKTTKKGSTTQHSSMVAHWLLVPGDHDSEPGGGENFHSFLVLISLLPFTEELICIMESD